MSNKVIDINNKEIFIDIDKMIEIKHYKDYWGLKNRLGKFKYIKKDKNSEFLYEYFNYYVMKNTLKLFKYIKKDKNSELLYQYYNNYIMNFETNK